MVSPGSASTRLHIGNVAPSMAMPVAEILIVSAGSGRCSDTDSGRVMPLGLQHFHIAVVHHQEQHQDGKDIHQGRRLSLVRPSLR